MEITCPNYNRASALFNIKHRPAIRIENDRVFLNFENLVGNRDTFVIWHADDPSIIEVFDHENRPDPKGYPKEKIKEVLVWCARCNTKSYLDYMRNEDLKEQILHGAFRGAVGTSVVVAYDTIRDESARPPFVVFTYSPQNTELLKQCWDDRWWKELFDKIDENLSLEKVKEAEVRTGRRYDLSIGRPALKQLFGDPTYRQKVLDDLKGLSSRFITLDMEDIRF